MAEMNVNPVEGNYIIYRNRPMVREDNVVCYGNLDEKYILQLVIMTEKKFKESVVPDKVAVQLMSTDKSLSPSEHIVKQSLQDGLSNALDLGITWLERALAK